MNTRNLLNNNDKFDIPILLILFNRPLMTEKLVNKLKFIKPSKIYVVADGPRKNFIDDISLCNKTEKIIDNNVNWPCEIKKKIRDKNVGLKMNINDGISWFFQNEEMGIILEDDCDANKSFYKFCEKLLIKYKDDNKIKVISGNYYFGSIYEADGYYFSRCPGTHGWATWRRVWNENDIEMTGWKKYKDFFWLLFIFNLNVVKAHYFYKKFNDSFNLIIDSWDYQLLYSIWKKNGLIIRPYKSLCKHIGWGDDATHSKGSDRHPEVEIKEMQFPIKHPSKFKINSKFDNLEIKNIRGVRFFNYIKYKIVKKYTNNH